MSTGEDIVPYGRRAVKLFDRLAATGVPEAQIPNAVQQATKLIEWLSNTSQVYHDYKNTSAIIWSATRSTFIRRR